MSAKSTESTKSAASALLIGWASRDVTPERPVVLHGQFHARISEGVLDPLTVTALALESVRDGRPVGQAVLVSCDYVGVSPDLLAAVKSRLGERLPEVDPRNVCLNATHTHTGPLLYANESISIGSLPPVKGLGEKDLGAMESSAYVAFAAGRIVEAIAEAWAKRAPGGIGFGLGQAVVGHNRRVAYFTGETRMYGRTDDPEFSHIEGGVDHSVNLLCTWDASKQLTGMVVNVACPSQVSEQLYQVSADYWHETRVELRRRFGAGLFVLAQCSAAGDQSPHVQVGKPAEERMLKLSGRTQRQDLGVRIADAVSAVLPVVEKEIDWQPAFAHRVETLELPMRRLEPEDVEPARAEAERAREKYEALRADLEAHPEKKKEPRWYVQISAAYARMRWNQGVEQRFKDQGKRTTQSVETHVLRLGSVALATNPFEYYLDFALQIKARSKATQTFIVQLAGGGVASYLPTVRATTGKSYGAIPASTPVGPEGGRMLAARTVEIVNELMA
ncbi:MAG TPA: hypothetical protein PK280_21080 [Planctomycetota bacterium]|nr:hypothetical protein [Planctomycetota bacterium]